MSKKRNNKNTKIIKNSEELSPIIIRVIIALVILALLLLGMFTFGPLGNLVNGSMRVVFGQYVIVYYILFMGITGIYAYKPSQLKMNLKNSIGTILVYIAIVLSIHALTDTTLIGWPSFIEYWNNIGNIFIDNNLPAYGGLIGAFFYAITTLLVDKGGVWIITVAFGLIGGLLLLKPSHIEKGKEWNEELKDRKKQRIKEKEKKKEEKIQSTINEISDSSSKPIMFLSADKEKKAKKVKNIKPQQESFKITEEIEPIQSTIDSNYTLPALTLLRPNKNKKSDINEMNANVKGKRLIEVLNQFGIDAELIDIHIGPAVTKFEIKPDSNVKISRINAIQDNIMMELAVKTLRIEAPIPGRNAVGIEVPNAQMDTVAMLDVIKASDKFRDTSNIQVALGKDLMGDPVVVSLNKMPHLLIAGATGSGKSVCMNSIITSLLLTKTPDELKMVLIDPKKVEFADYESIPHLWTPVISDPQKAASALEVVVTEMESRYERFAEAGVRNISAYNNKVKNKADMDWMPWIVVIIDELADLMAVAGKDVEMSIQRITQLARASGIHLIVATQRPSVDVVTGIIKANIPSRIAFAVSSAVDSRTILDSVGAEKLLGQGDMLYLPMGEPNPIRVQGVYVSDDEVSIVSLESKKQASPTYNDAFINIQREGDELGTGQSQDPIYDEVYDFVISQQKASTSLLQRRFKIGYNRAANLIDDLEQMGVIGPANGSKPRTVNPQLVLEDDDE